MFSPYYSKMTFVSFERFGNLTVLRVLKWSLAEVDSD